MHFTNSTVITLKVTRSREETCYIYAFIEACGNFNGYMPYFRLSDGVYNGTCNGEDTKNACHTHYDTDVDELPYPYLCVDDYFAGYGYFKQYNGSFRDKADAYNRYGNGGYNRNGL